MRKRRERERERERERDKTNMFVVVVAHLGAYRQETSKDTDPSQAPNFFSPFLIRVY